MDTGTTIDGDTLVARVRDLTGLDTQQAAAAAEATLAALGERLPQQDISVVANVLPGRFAHALERRAWPGEFGLEELFRRVAQTEGVNLGFAREHVLSTCRALGEKLSDETRGKLQRSLPAPFAQLFEPYDAEKPPPDHGAAHGAQHHSLATGRTGSAHPIAEAHPSVAETHSKD